MASTASFPPIEKDGKGKCYRKLKYDAILIKVADSNTDVPKDMTGMGRQIPGTYAIIEER